MLENEVHRQESINVRVMAAQQSAVQAYREQRELVQRLRRRIKGDAGSPVGEGDGSRMGMGRVSGMTAAAAAGGSSASRGGDGGGRGGSPPAGGTVRGVAAHPDRLSSAEARGLGFERGDAGT